MYSWQKQFNVSGLKEPKYPEQIKAWKLAWIEVKQQHRVKEDS